MKTALSIAGSDSSGGAGIQADIKTMMANGVYAMTAITALTAQNTTGVSAILEVSPAFLRQQIDSVFQDIPPDAVKIGMVPSPALVEVIAQRLEHYHAQRVVVDPVMVATSGSTLSRDSAVGAMKELLFPLATVITPNIPESEALTGRTITTQADMEGGHHVHDASDLLCMDGACTWFHGARIQNPNTHGTGCTLSSAIASNLAKGFSLEESIQRAKAYISGALSAMLDLGHGSGPLHHGYDLKSDMI